MHSLRSALLPAILFAPLALSEARAAGVYFYRYRDRAAPREGTTSGRIVRVE